jgi:hypothetical protein
VKGLSSVKDAEAIPVCAMSVGSSRLAELIKFWCKGGIPTGERRSLDIATFSESIAVESCEPRIVVSEVTPCR